MKTEVKNSISKFFSKKQIKKEQESKPEEKGPCDESVETSLLKSLKEEPEIDDNIGIPSFSEKGDHDSKSSGSQPPQESAVKCLMKRDYEELLADSKPQTDEIDKQCTSPLRKKGNLKSTSDKQPTLFSYFGKK